MKTFTKAASLVASVVLINLVSNFALGACFPKPPLNFGDYHPIKIMVNPTTVWLGKIKTNKDQTLVEIRDSKNQYVGGYQIEELKSSGSETGYCKPGVSFAEFKIKKIIGDDGNTRIKIERTKTGKYVTSVLWKGVLYKRAI